MKKNSSLSLLLLAAGASGLGALLLGMKSETPARGPRAEGPVVIYVRNPGGATLGHVAESGVKILEREGKYFKDLNKNGQLDKYEDWRLPAQQRALDLAAQLSVAQIAGLMLYSGHQAVPAKAGPFAAGTYQGKPFAEGSTDAAAVTDQQRKFLLDDNLRHVLLTQVQSPETAARWNNNVQALVEGAGLGIPANNSSDPRHGTNSGVEYTAGAGGQLSHWPDELGLAATFDPAITQQFGTIAAQEYRALGITTALSPQIDLASEPRWSRIADTFGEDPQLSADMARAYVDGFQTSTGAAEIADGWGYNSVNAMIKHWPGGGPEEGGRDAHYAYGKYAVYPGHNFDEHLIPFVDGALKLNGKTKMAAAVMPYYTVSSGVDAKNKESVGNGYSQYLITDLLRQRYGFDGVVCTDWGITNDEGATPAIFGGKPWGMEGRTVAERHYKILMAGADQFGGNNAAGPIVAAYAMGVKAHGEAFMRARMEQSAVRLLRNIFRLGLFENPYLDAQKTQALVGNAEFMRAGYAAQQQSVVLLKNAGQALPIPAKKTVYVPQKFIPSQQGFFGPPSAERYEDVATAAVLARYFNVTSDPAKADYALVFIGSPSGGAGYATADVQKGGTGYVPISLQYGPYTATQARAHSLAAGDPAEPTVADRTYRGKSVATGNAKDLEIIRQTYAAMKGKPVIVAIDAAKPLVPAEFEQYASGLLVSFGVSHQAVLDIVTGKAEPRGLLPVQLPATMQTVEEQNEDIPHDMVCYTDAAGHRYDFGYGLNWQGVIRDARTARYANRVAPPLIKVAAGRVTLSSPTPGAQLYYTTTGATPAFTAANAYKQPFTLPKGATVKALAKVPGVDNSSLAMYAAPAAK
ncbi:glycoside hydrolase family 3 N-terminal domain-containing protein [Hymenobacter nivis]|uniref:beta-glucosidase n=1 Tax=Hymenobacter nivis TaxID=1850093 RepID=A0A502GWZ9_9BACT|nr:glycoside hydrolase family 3 N-terminal domain-containing protein [Hymenobacter nivis]TPG66414.1 beta-glucosidase [Hymenobacter nivis]